MHSNINTVALGGDMNPSLGRDLCLSVQVYVCLRFDAESPVPGLTCILGLSQ